MFFIDKLSYASKASYYMYYLEILQNTKYL